MNQSDPSLLDPLIASLSRHNSFNAAELQALRALPGRVVQVQARTDFVNLGEETTDASFVVEGLIGRFDQTRKGQRQVVALYLDGDIPDLHSVVVPHASSALHAFTASSLIRIPHSALKLSAAQHAGIAQAFWRECAMDVAKVSKWVLSVGRYEAATRMAHLICEATCRLTNSATPGSIDFSFPVTHANLSDMLGTSQVHVNRTLKKLRMSKLATIERGRINILDWEKLAQAADFDADYLSLGNASTTA